MKYVLYGPNNQQTIIDERTLTQAIIENVERIRAEYELKIAAGIMYAGKPLQIDPASQMNMTAVVGQITAGMTLSPKFKGWRMGDNTFLTVTPTEMKALAQAASDRVMVLREAMWTAIDTVRAAQTREAADAVKVNWP